MSGNGVTIGSRTPITSSVPKAIPVARAQAKNAPCAAAPGCAPTISAPTTVSPAAASVVLLGDPQQLDQPQKASHPDGTDISALAHVLGTARTMPSDRGIFLASTWRLPPSICRFTSEVFYEGRLGAPDSLGVQRLDGIADAIERSVPTATVTDIPLPPGLWEMRVVSRGFWAAPRA